MLENICRSVPVVTKKDEAGTKGILKIKNSLDQGENFLTIVTKSASGPNPNLAKGPKDDLLL